MERQLVLKEIISKKKLTFEDELNEIILSLNLPKYNNKTGNKQFTTTQKLSCVILYFRSKLGLREFCDNLNNETNWDRKLGLKYKITKSSLNRWVSEFDLDFLKKVLDKTNRDQSPKILGIDGSGLSTKYKSSYYEKRLKDFGVCPKSPYHKLDIICDLENGKNIFDFTFTMKQYNDKKQAKRLFKRFKFKNIYIIGDKGYYYYWLFSRMNDLNNTLIVPPIKIDGKCKGDNFIRRRFQKTFFDNKHLYSKRNNVEGVFSALKRTILGKIVSKHCTTKKREVSFKIIIYNIKKNVFQTFLFFINFNLNIKKYHKFNYF